VAESLFNMRNFNPELFGKVAIVMGGWSAEREVSLMSGQQVFESLSSAGVDAHPMDAGRDIANVLVEGGFDRAFLILHGRGGEDGTLQGALELAGIPYTGTGVLGSALCMDKWRAKALVKLAGVATPVAKLVATVEEAKAAADEIAYPVVVKPTLEGSSIGVSIVESKDEIASAFSDAKRYGPVLVEQKMVGLELAATVIGDSVLPLVSMADDTEYNCPVNLPAATIAKIETMALDAFTALGCKAWARVDFMLDDAGEPHFIECNTAPGMTSHSLVPVAALQAGVDFSTICMQILSDTLTTVEAAA